MAQNLRKIKYNLTFNPKQHMKQVATFIAISALFFACKTKDKDVAGKGGSATISVFPQHHEVAKNLTAFKAYIKYGTKDAPTSGLYDDSMVLVNHDSLVSGSFAGLKNGDYYLYASGYDTSVNSNLHGGLPYTVTAQTPQSVFIPVSE